MKHSSEESLQSNPPAYIRAQIDEFVLTSPACRLPFMDGYSMWEKPLVRFADGDDPLFTEYKRIISPLHLTPREALAKACNQDPADMPERLSVISWVLPIAERTLQANRAETRAPSRIWSHTRWYGEKSNDALRAYVVKLLKDAGYLTAAPVLEPFFEISENEEGMYSNWSERHIAYAAGQGTFSLSDGLITGHGVAHRCGHAVTSLELPADPRTAETPYSNCLYYLGVKCDACIKRCPAGAISEKGHDKNLCLQYCIELGYSPEELKKGYDNERSVIGCGLCQTKVPCEHRNPSQLKTVDH